MANISIPPTVTFGKDGNIGTTDPSKFSRTGSAYSTDPNLFIYELKKAMNTDALDILFGDEETRSNSVFGSGSALGGNTSSASDPFSDLTGQNSFDNSLAPQIEMIARSNLIGKTVSAINPSTKSKIEGKVESISVTNGTLLFNLNVNGTIIKVPSENLLSVSE
ncbi:MAG: hypothetical protein NT099_04375 [Candidatus Saganbacteria bacterium]|nr:hypothetical protein [Candidatus Saganbacteria bacterium]